MNFLKNADPDIFGAIRNETNRQNTKLELIASENFVSRAVLEAAGSIMTNKYAEGYPGKRYYGGCEFVDVAENIARDRAKNYSGRNMPMSSRTPVHRRTWRFILRSLSRAIQSWA